MHCIRNVNAAVRSNTTCVLQIASVISEALYSDNPVLVKTPESETDLLIEDASHAAAIASSVLATHLSKTTLQV